MSTETDIQVERERQDAQWGGPAHDDTHETKDWFKYIEHQIAWARHREGHDRKRLVKIAALAIAALDSIDRKEANRWKPCKRCTNPDYCTNSLRGCDIEEINR